jgi:hypothetical protein
MRAILIALTGMCVLAGGSANAQFTIEPILDRQPINLAFGADVSLSRFGPNVVATAKAFAALRGAQGIVDAALPEINRRLACVRGRKIGAEVVQIRPQSSYGIIGRADSFTIDVKANVRRCGFGFYGGDVAVSVPVTITARERSIALAAGPVQVDSNVYVVSLVRVPEDVVRRATADIKPQVEKVVAMMNRWINSQLFNPALRRQIAAYSLKVVSPRLEMQQGVLTVSVELSGQVPVKTVNRWMSGL